MRRSSGMRYSIGTSTSTGVFDSTLTKKNKSVAASSANSFSVQFVARSASRTLLHPLLQALRGPPEIILQNLAQHRLVEITRELAVLDDRHLAALFRDDERDGVDLLGGA